ncbi:hypothetical protein EMIHUDRAFT_252711 [Emiliania huxleyi CCMP1516]|uniref:Acetylornithine aminotransferase n=2 Tax=Emiliania huxleyi TaxID=2903 RepID=A0A0D3KGN1_EMIH1|nr:hypothetical protein EMIHUDRAFT_252711 [Emiliania huxleyi CCMP1516]EOD34916.1 hypothetical protein EMIHUDRAFT_252711 [Emiliania huxleyi CCMP1516]|eukprot:XP_005787345.1 hypothetical protein EMIHUDRAFT_252711 [Emiliania huxleyi CCMP1516]
MPPSRPEGKLFASERFLPEATPDVLVMAKGARLDPPRPLARRLASGFPLAALAASSSLTDAQPPGSMGGTYAGNAVSCAAAVATQRGARLRAALGEVAARRGEGVVRDVRGHGCMLGLELAASQPAGTAKRACAARGLLLLNCSVYETLRFIPPLTVAPAEVDEACEVFDAALAEVVA